MAYIYIYKSSTLPSCIYSTTAYINHMNPYDTTWFLSQPWACFALASAFASTSAWVDIAPLKVAICALSTSRILPWLLPLELQPTTFIPSFGLTVPPEYFTLYLYKKSNPYPTILIEKWGWPSKMYLSLSGVAELATGGHCHRTEAKSQVSKPAQSDCIGRWKILSSHIHILSVSIQNKYMKKQTHASSGLWTCYKTR